MFEVGLTFLGPLGDDAVHFVRVRDVQLASVHKLLKVIALVERAAEASLPGRRVRLVDPLPKLAFKQRPGLQTDHQYNVLEIYIYIHATYMLHSF